MFLCTSSDKSGLRVSRLQSDARRSEIAEREMHKGKRGGILWRLSEAGADGRQVWKQVQEILLRIVGDNSSASCQPEDEAAEKTQPEALLLNCSTG